MAKLRHMQEAETKWLAYIEPLAIDIASTLALNALALIE
jgi:hypothetical protein